MKRNGFLEMLGYVYIANHYTREIHRVVMMTSKCRLPFMRNASYCTARKARKLMKKGYNGCKYCNKDNDKG